MITPVANNIYRSPRPTKDDAGELLKLGIKTLISLEGEEEDQKEVKEFPFLKVISLPISFCEIYITGISQSYFNSILGIVATSFSPVLVHCQHGEDRTGLIIAGYRVKYMNWSKDEAMHEALKFGYRSWLNFGLNQSWSNFQ